MSRNAPHLPALDAAEAEGGTRGMGKVLGREANPRSGSGVPGRRLLCYESIQPFPVTTIVNVIIVVCVQ